jgi:hypothetical protein
VSRQFAYKLLECLPACYGVETHSGSDIFWRLLKKSDFKMVAALKTTPARLATTRLTSSIAAGVVADINPLEGLERIGTSSLELLLECPEDRACPHKVLKSF